MLIARPEGPTLEAGPKGRERGGELLGKGAASPSPPSREYGERHKLPGKF